MEQHTNPLIPSGHRQKLCMRCMELYRSELTACPHCGYIENSETPGMLHIDPGTMLAGRYIIGNALGSGGFGVTYIAWDTELKRKVAIKEYLPSQFATRMLHGQDLILTGDDKNRRQFTDGMQKFIQEGQRLAKVGTIEGIVHMYDCFEANNTAYITMEYLKGRTLESLLKEKGTLSEVESMDILLPVLNALEHVHALGIIHRDLAPDNIFLAENTDGTVSVKLIDFGAARFASTSQSKSLTVLIKPGYSPEEQYRSNGDQGPHTDVYAAAACFYRMVTGILPPDALERRVAIENKKKDPLQLPGKYAPDLSSNVEIALLNALNVRIEDRTPTVTDFERELISYEPVKRRGSTIRRIDFMRWPIWAKIGVPIGGAASVALLIVAALWVFKGPDAMYKLPSGMTRVPDFVTASFEEAQSWAENASILLSSTGTEYAPNMEGNLVLSQDTAVGSVVVSNSEVCVVLSTGEENYLLPDVQGMSLDDAKYALTCMGLTVQTTEGSQPGLAANCIITQSEDPYSETKSGAEITLTVNTGTQVSGGTAPNLIGSSYGQALELAAQTGVSLQVSEKVFSDDITEPTVQRQSIASGEAVPSGKALDITVALPKRDFQMPNLLYKDRAIAAQLLKNIGIQATEQEEVSDIVASGLVLSQSIDKEETVHPGDAVVLTVSKGGKPFSMPNVVGFKEDDARSALSDKGLAVEVEFGYDASVKEGCVISQSIPADQDVTRGTTITIVICSTDGLITVQDVVGSSSESASSALKSQGFKVQIVETYSDSVSPGNVISQLPRSGTVQAEGTTIVLTVCKERPAEKNENATQTPSVPQQSSSNTTAPTPEKQKTRETTTSTNPSLPGWTLYDQKTSLGEYGAWSSWSTSAVSENSNRKVETKNQYRYRDKETTTSTSSSLSGWNSNGSSTSWGSYGNWSDWSTNGAVASDNRDVQTRYAYHYYYFVCPACGRHMHGWGTNACYTWAGGCGSSIYESSYTAIKSTIPYTSSSDWHGTGVRYANTEYGLAFAYTAPGSAYYVAPVTQYRYRERSQTTTYSYWRWGSWSSWSDHPVSGSSNREIETQTLYRYATRSEVTTYYYERYI